MHNAELTAFALAEVDEWLSGDDRTLAFQVTDDAGNGVDISSADVSWSLFERAYQTDPADAVLDDSDSGVEVVTDTRVDTSIGEFEVRVDGEATDDLWGEFTQRPRVEQADDSSASWVGDVVITM